VGVGSPTMAPSGAEQCCFVTRDLTFRRISMTTFQQNARAEADQGLRCCKHSRPRLATGNGSRNRRFGQLGVRETHMGNRRRVSRKKHSLTKRVHPLTSPHHGIQHDRQRKRQTVCHVSIAACRPACDFDGPDISRSAKYCPQSVPHLAGLQVQQRHGAGCLAVRA